MHEPTVIHNTFVIERSFNQPPERVFAVFSDPVTKRRWYAEGSGHETDSYETIFEVGGREQSSYRLGANTPFPGLALTSEGRYEDIVPERRIVTSSTMSLGGRHISTSIVTFEFLATDQGCDLICTHQGVFYEGSDGPERREGGWRQLLGKLEKELDASLEGQS